MKLIEGKINQKYTITRIDSLEEEMRDFLFTLGCYPGKSITIISQVSSCYIVNVKDARYSLDKDLVSVIEIQKSADNGDYSTIAV